MCFPLSVLVVGTRKRQPCAARRQATVCFLIAPMNLFQVIDCRPYALAVVVFRLDFVVSSQAVIRFE
jgi:hypothetical protein